MFNKNYSSNRKNEERAPRLVKAELEHLLAAHIRNPVMFAEGKMCLTVDHFDLLISKPCRLIWAAALKLANENGGSLPEQGLEITLRLRCDSIIGNSPNTWLITDTERVDISEIIDFIFTVSSDQLAYTRAREDRNRLLDHHGYMTLVALTSDIVQNGCKANSKERIEDVISKVTSAKALGADLIKRGAFDKSILDDPPPDEGTPWRTGLPFFDKPMQGGQLVGEIYTLMGPTGVGKTTLGLQLAINSVRVQKAMKEADPNHIPGISVFITYEQDYNKILLKAWACAARIKLSQTDIPKFSELKNTLSGLRSDGTYVPLKDYEEREFFEQIRAAGGPDKYMGEYGRLLATMEEFGADTLQIIDMTDTKNNGPDWGTRSLDDILIVLKRLTAPDPETGDPGKRIASVYIDYVGLVVDQYLIARNIAMAEKRHYLKKFGMDCIRLIAIPYQCSVWLLQQLNTNANRANPTKVISHTEGEECGQIAQNATFAFQLGTKDTATNACQLSCTKARRGQLPDKHPVLRIDGAFSSMADASDYLIAEAGLQRIINKNGGGGLVSTETVQQNGDYSDAAASNGVRLVPRGRVAPPLRPEAERES